MSSVAKPSAASVIDFRSDFLSRPTAAMVAAMAAAAAEGCGFEFGEHPREKALEEQAAAILGFERALFCVTCAQANQIAIHLQCRPGESIVAEASSHVVISEAGAFAALSGALVKGLVGRLGILNPSDVEDAISSGAAQRSRTALVLLENTHVRAGGTVTSLETMQRVSRIARERGVPVHLDGSRIFNAAAALGVAAAQIAGCADSVAVSLNKGLAAPQGAILAGSDAFIEQALRIRQMMGGGWRPAPALCAAASVALETMPQRLHADHENAVGLADGIAGCSRIAVAREALQTNLVLADIVDPALRIDDLTASLAAGGIRVLPFGKRRIRLAFYHDIGPDEINRAVDVFRAIAN